MFARRISFILILLIISIVIVQGEKKKTCIRNLITSGINLLTANRKQLLVVGITNFNNESARIQANRYNDLNRELLERHNIRDSLVRFILINEKEAAKNIPGNYYDKIRLYQDNIKDRLVEKLRRNKPTANNFVFGRCGYLIFSQDGSNADLSDGKNYQALLRFITVAVKYRRPCEALCS